MNRVLVSILFTLCSLVAFAQYIVQGKVTDRGKNPLMGVNVIFRSDKGKMLQYAITDSEGNFRCSLTEKTYSMEVSMMGFRKYSSNFEYSPKAVTIVLEEENFQLKEVTVNAEKIRENGDTITYLVSSFSQQQDRSIGDVLKRLPGVEVTETGKIQYQGEDISKFYIEGSDLLGGRYGIATNGISKEDIGSVEILENHQPKQVLKGLLMSDKAAINLRLRNSVKDVWIAHGQIGAGYNTHPKRGIWNEEWILMNVKPNFQTLTTLKSNNTGINLEKEFTDQVEGTKKTALSPYVNPSVILVPQLKESRSLFNKESAISTNSLWSRDDKEQNFQFNYISKWQEYTSGSTTVYTLPSGQKIIMEQRQGKEYVNEADATLNLETNKKSYYLNNTLKAHARWDNYHINTIGTMTNKETFRVPDYYISNDLQVIKRFAEKHLISFISRNEWESLPQNLFVTYSDGEMLQKLGDHAFFSEEKFQYGFRLHKLRISLEGGMSAYLRSLHGNTSTNSLSLFLTPEVEYSRKKVSVTLTVPYSHTYFFLSILDNGLNLNFVSPSFMLRYKPISALTLSLNGGLGNLPVNLHDIHQNLIQANYRTQLAGIDSFYVSDRKRISGRMAYRNVYLGFFGTIQAGKTWNTSPYKSSQSFQGNQVILGYLPFTMNGQTTHANGILSQTLNFIRGGISLNAAYLKNRREMVNEGKPMRYATESISLLLTINGRHSDWLAWNYKLTGTQVSMNSILRNKLHQYRHAFSLALSPMKKLTWQIETEAYRNEITERTYKDILFLDSNLSYKISAKTELAFSATNLLNHKEYNYTSFGNLTTVLQNWGLRGRELMLIFRVKK